MERLSKSDKVKTLKLIDEVVTRFTESKSISKISPGLIVMVMEFVEIITGLSGKGKKELAMYILIEIGDKVSEIHADYEIVGETIDIMIDLARGKFNINKVSGCMSKSGGLFSCCK